MRHVNPMIVWGILLAMTVTAFAEHVDIRPYVSGGSIVTGTSELVGATVTPLSDHQRVFGAEFGEDDPGQPFMTEDPGFLSEDGAFPGGAGRFVGFNTLAGLTYWTGSGFAGVPASESLHITKGSQSLVLGTAPAAGFNFAVIDAGNGLHEHLTFELLGSDGNPVPGDGIEPTPGVYLLEMNLTTTMPGVGDSLPFWIAFNSGGEDFEEQHDAAIDWVQTNLVPEPVTGMLLAMGIFTATRRREPRCAER